MYLFIFFALPALAKATYVITVYGDVYKDTTFFTRTYPWIVDNIGGDITADYQLQGSGRYSVPQMCALGQLRSNTYLQAEFLKCEAQGTRSEICLCRSGIDPRKFRQCVLERGNLARLAVYKHSELNLDVTPIIELGPRITVSQVPDDIYLKKICTIFGDDKPRGCVKPFTCENSTYSVESRALAYFECKELDRTYQQTTTTAHQTSTTGYPTSTSSYPTSTTGYPTSTTGYPTSTTGYPTYTSSYPTSTTGYPTSTTSYPTSSTGYPTYTTSYPTSTTSYPTSTTGYPTYTTSYPTSTTSYPTSTTGYPTSTTSYPTSTTGYPTYTTSYPTSTTPLSSTWRSPSATGYPPTPLSTTWRSITTTGYPTRGYPRSFTTYWTNTPRHLTATTNPGWVSITNWYINTTGTDSATAWYVRSYPTAS